MLMIPMFFMEKIRQVKEIKEILHKWSMFLNRDIQYHKEDKPPQSYEFSVIQSTPNKGICRA